MSAKVWTHARPRHHKPAFTAVSTSPLRALDDLDQFLRLDAANVRKIQFASSAGPALLLLEKLDESPPVSLIHT